MIKKILLLIPIIMLSSALGAKFQFNFNIGQDKPDDGEERSGSATLLKFGLSTKPTTFRFTTGFSYATGSGGFSQGDFTLGTQLYPLASLGRKTPGQPFLFLDGKVGFGSLDKTARTDAGFGMGAGIDLQMFKTSGFTFAVEQHSASESSTRLWLGFYWQ